MKLSGAEKAAIGGTVLAAALLAGYFFRGTGSEMTVETEKAPPTAPVQTVQTVQSSNGEEPVRVISGWENPIPEITRGPAGESADGRLDLNTATAEELETLPGIGAVRAQAIVDYRERQGGFATVEDLLSVSGIGEKTLEGLRDLIKVEDGT